MRVEVKFSSKRFLLTLMLCACSVILLQNHDLSRDASFTFRLLCLAAAVVLLVWFAAAVYKMLVLYRGEPLKFRQLIGMLRGKKKPEQVK